MSSLNLSEENIRGLHAFGDQSPDVISSLSTAVFTILLKKPHSSGEILSQQESLAEVDERLLKLCYATLVAISLEGAKLGTSGSVLRDALEEHIGDKADALAPFFTLYDKSMSALRSALQQNSWHLPHIVDVDWRLDYVVRDSALLTYDKPSYFISLKTESQRHFQETIPFDSASSEPTVASPYKSIEFACSLQQMEDLLDTLKDAVKQAERLQNTN